jgi:hypothetical protein
VLSLLLTDVSNSMSKWPDEAKSAPQATEKNGVLVGVDELLLATPHSNLDQSLCTCLVNRLVPPPSLEVTRNSCYFVGTPHLAECNRLGGGFKGS